MFNWEPIITIVFVVGIIISVFGLAMFFITISDGDWWGMPTFMLTILLIIGIALGFTIPSKSEEPLGQAFSVQARATP